jgi:biofilm protein TabA
MILDNLNDSALYEGINPLFKQAFDYIKSLDLATVELGKTVLVDDELIVMVNSTGLKSPDKARMEVHNAFIDIHVPISNRGTLCLEAQKYPGNGIRTLRP